ncbi:MAG: flagellar biosynthesis anti-sigma factor FlgM [Sphingomonadales bacterium]|nr:flagellar biosynthesis anti-sigma factor FlgM [Sphingomonadales bacterium]
MPPIELGPSRPIGAIDAGAIDARAVRSASGEKPAAARSDKAQASAAPSVERSDALDPGQPPIDADRVAQIRKAVESGTYPIVPAKIADAIIAAGMLLRTAK